ncbi:hypothetical protein L9F63_010227, partial [Diploptera punctata]
LYYLVGIYLCNSQLLAHIWLSFQKDGLNAIISIRLLLPLMVTPYPKDVCKSFVISATTSIEGIVLSATTSTEGIVKMIYE